MAISAQHIVLAKSLASNSTGELDIIGTLGEFVGKGGVIAFNKKNVADKGKALMLNLTTKTGDIMRVFGSKAVSASIRANGYTTAELLGLRVVASTTNDGNPSLTVIAWESDSIELAVGNTTAVSNAAANVTSIASLEALAGI